MFCKCSAAMKFVPSMLSKLWNLFRVCSMLIKRWNSFRLSSASDEIRLPYAQQAMKFVPLTLSKRWKTLSVCSASDDIRSAYG
jgi:hypothetical protein